MEAKNFKSRREHRKDVNRFNRYIKGENWDIEISQSSGRSENQKLDPLSWNLTDIKGGSRIHPHTIQRLQRTRMNSIY